MIKGAGPSVHPLQAAVLSPSSLPPPQGYTRPDQTSSRLDSQWLALSLPCALPLSIPSFCCSLGWTVHSSIPAAALSGPGDFSWETQWGILPQCEELPNSSVSSESFSSCRNVGRYCLIRVFLFSTRASHGMVASPLLHIPAGFHDWISTDHSAGFKGYFLFCFVLNCLSCWWCFM